MVYRFLANPTFPLNDGALLDPKPSGKNKTKCNAFFLFVSLGRGRILWTSSGCHLSFAYYSTRQKVFWARCGTPLDVTSLGECMAHLYTTVPHDA